MVKLLIYFYKYFTIISAQREGSLSDATNPKTNQTDPYYAYCKMHVDKHVAKLVYIFFLNLETRGLLLILNA